MKLLHVCALSKDVMWSLLELVLRDNEECLS